MLRLLKDNFHILRSLILKEITIICRNRHLLFLLLFPTTIQLTILGASLDPSVRNVQLAVIDTSRSHESRALINNLNASLVFHCLDKTVEGITAARQQMQQGKFAALVQIPASYEPDLEQRHKSEVQACIDGMDTRVGNIVRAYIKRIILRLGQVIPPLVDVRSHYVFNPGLRSSWYFVPGVLGCLLTLTGTLVSSAALLRERQSGTLEQLFMLPTQPWQILLSKVLPIVALMMIDVVIALSIALVIFQLPFTGSVSAFATASLVFVMTVVGLGTILANGAKRQREAQLTSFFVNIPVVLLSGALVPLETMPPLLQAISAINPLRYYQSICHACMLRSAGWTDISIDFYRLLFCAAVVWILSVVTFRRQLA